MASAPMSANLRFRVLSERPFRVRPLDPFLTRSQDTAVWVLRLCTATTAGLDDLRRAVEKRRHACFGLGSEALLAEGARMLVAGEIFLVVEDPPQLVPLVEKHVLAADYVERYQFTFSNEVWIGHSETPHWPGGASGLTLGPGYDIGGRTTEEVETFLVTTLGLLKEEIKIFADGAKKKGQSAKTYLHDNKKELAKLTIKRDKEEIIFRILAPKYEKAVALYIDKHYGKGSWDKLGPAQCEILFDYQYNTGGLGGWPKLVKAVIKQDWAVALTHYVRNLTRRDLEMKAKLNALLKANPKAAKK